MIGGNFRLDALQAAVLGVKLKYLESWSAKRRANAAIYDRRFAGSVIKTPKIEANNQSIYNQYTVCVPDRDKLLTYIGQKQIGAAVYYPVPLHLQQCFQDLGYKTGDFPVTEKLCSSVLSLPVYPELSNEQIHEVADAIKAFYK
jgi:dTDP-4-amino-4,6-dideoxygalactose transaminase